MLFAGMAFGFANLTNAEGVCTMERNPVCGSNMVTYGNACGATNAGVTYTAGSCDKKSNPSASELVLWAHAKGITSFSTVADFRYDDRVSRQEASKMIVNFAKAVKGEEFDLTIKNAACTFVDSNLFGSTLVSYVTTACQQNIFKGIAETKGLMFYPNENFTRAQAVAVLIRVAEGTMLENVNPWYKNYLDKADAITEGYVNADDYDFEGKVTRGELIAWMFHINKHYAAGGVDIILPPVVIPVPDLPLTTGSVSTGSTGWIWSGRRFTGLVFPTGGIDLPDGLIDSP